MMDRIRHYKGFIAARLAERSTQGSMLAAITAAAALSKPWNVIFAVLATVFAMVPNDKPSQ